jgi:hypothetical protein
VVDYLPRMCEATKINTSKKKNSKSFPYSLGKKLNEIRPILLFKNLLYLFIYLQFWDLNP